MAIFHPTVRRVTGAGVGILLVVLGIAAGCRSPIRNVTRSREPRYAVLREGRFETVRPLYVIERQGQYRLVPGQRSAVIPYEISDYHGQPRPCPGMGRRARWMGIIPAGWEIRVVRVLEGEHPRNGFYNVIEGELVGKNKIRYELVSLFQDEGGVATFSRRRLVPDRQWLRPMVPGAGP